MADTRRPPSGSRTIGGQRLTVDLTGSGDVHRIAADGLLVSQYLPGVHDAPVGGLWLRRLDDDGAPAAVAALVGRGADVRSVEVGGLRARWRSVALGVPATVELTVDPDADLWVWRVELGEPAGDGGTEPIRDGGTEPAGDGARYDLVAAQDLALAPPAAALSSEAYVCQYLLHRRVEHPTAGVALVSRQTMAAAPLLPLHVMFSPRGAVASSTDSLQLHTPLARRDALPHGLTTGTPDGVLQYEYSAPALVTRPFKLGDGPVVRDVVHVVRTDSRTDLDAHAASLASWAELAETAASRPETLEPFSPTRSLLRDAPPLAGDDLSTPDLLAALGIDAADVRLPEHGDDGELLSFFTPTSAHVVTGAKETLAERSHGHILRAGDAIRPTPGLLAATAFAPGVFASHVVAGNTTANRVVGVHRHHLNLQRASGVRVLVDPGDGPRLLTAPSALTIDLGGVHWLYEGELGRIDVWTTVAADRSRLDVTVRCELDLSVRFTVELDEEGGGWHRERIDADTLVLVPADGSAVQRHDPGLAYALRGTAGLDDDAELFDGARPPGPVTHLATAPTRRTASLTLTSSLDGPAAARALLGRPVEDAEREARLTAHREQARTVLGLTLRPHDALAAEELDALVPWYVHDALTHFLSPHGLEQYSGAAWGTRDVSQGPFELMTAAGRHDVVRDIVLRTFARQHRDGDYPQWFMFDSYAEVYSATSHGDIVVWPLFALGQYLEATGDLAVLEETVPFWDDETRAPAVSGPDATATVRDHLRRTLDFLDAHRLPGTDLPAYGEGDWDDTLQPADPELRTRLASTWTAALLAQATGLLADALGAGAGADGDSVPDADGLAARLRTTARGVGADLRERALVDGVLSGYVQHGDDGDALVIHPRDVRTGMTYRLIPMTRSIIAGLLTPQEAVAHELLISDELLFPDGVRLMDRPADFTDGIPRTFLRAEQAANVGREVGLMYVHAHIRYVEALARLGRARAIDELLRISPVGLHARQPNAAARQRNAYFSSSDAAFPDRYAFAAGFERVRTGDVPVRGGWRVYSSGPGIFLHQLLSHVLGLRRLPDRLVVDPVLPAAADGLRLELVIDGRRRTIGYVAAGPGEGPAILAPGRGELPVEPAAPNPYRPGGLALPYAVLGDVDDLVVRFVPRD
ncbi:hypothetical protein [Salana multivorans]|uniref:hypothetical protein n=1 Tax=Salana multivorans TaxID=120377 RepID=UPI00248F585B|nr:hypothetical protein [Salana multivorans]